MSVKINCVISPCIEVVESKQKQGKIEDDINTLLLGFSTKQLKGYH